MLTNDQLNNLKAGDKLIFVENGGVLSAKKGNVFTFAKWYISPHFTKDQQVWWQCKELLEIGNKRHNFSIYEVELFDENIHKEFTIMDASKLLEAEKEFIRKYGE